MRNQLLIICRICFVTLLINLKAKAQTDVQNTGILYSSSSTDTIFVGGSFTNASGAALTNNGVLNIKQHLVNNQAAMTVGTGKLFLNGSSVQQISGTQTFKTYDLLTANNSGFTLNNNLSVSGIHTFSNGMITTSATPNYMVYEAGSSYTGDNDSKHINGWVKKVGATDFVFPVGNATYERTVSLTNLTAASEFNVKHNTVTPSVNDLMAPLVLVDTNEYWTINKISGGSAKVVLNWAHPKIPVPQVTISNIRAAYYSGSFWTSLGGTGTGNVATTGSVTSNLIAAFNYNFTIGSISLVLPLHIISFTGQRENNYNAISWVVSNEINVAQYELQRSVDGINFYTIYVQQSNNAGSTAYYNYHDGGAVNSKVFYRFMYNDNNAGLKYSDIISITAASADSRPFYVIKNPVSSKIEIYTGAVYKGLFNYNLVNSNGQSVQSGNINIAAAGVQTIPLQPYISKGIYILVLKNKEYILQATILKE